MHKSPLQILRECVKESEGDLAAAILAADYIFAFDESKVVRGGDPRNRGRFSKKKGSDKKDKSSKSSKESDKGSKSSSKSSSSSDQRTESSTEPVQSIRKGEVSAKDISQAVGKNPEEARLEVQKILRESAEDMGAIEMHQMSIKEPVIGTNINGLKVTWGKDSSLAQVKAANAIEGLFRNGDVPYAMLRYTKQVHFSGEPPKTMVVAKAGTVGGMQDLVDWVAKKIFGINKPLQFKRPSLAASTGGGSVCYYKTEAPFTKREGGIYNPGRVRKSSFYDPNSSDSDSFEGRFLARQLARNLAQAEFGPPGEPPENSDFYKAWAETESVTRIIKTPTGFTFNGSAGVDFERCVMAYTVNKQQFALTEPKKYAAIHEIITRNNNPDYDPTQRKVTLKHWGEERQVIADVYNTKQYELQKRRMELQEARERRIASEYDNPYKQGTFSTEDQNQETKGYGWRVVSGQTPSGGSLSIMRFFDTTWKLVEPNMADVVEITELDAKGQEINRTSIALDKSNEENKEDTTLSTEQPRDVTGRWVSEKDMIRFFQGLPAQQDPQGSIYHNDQMRDDTNEKIQDKQKDHIKKQKQPRRTTTRTPRTKKKWISLSNNKTT